MKLILASTSPSRKLLLSRLGIAFSTAQPVLDERAYDPLFHTMTDSAFAETLARKKAESLFASHPDAFILAGDQIATFSTNTGRHLLHKPETKTAAIQQLGQLAGRTHHLTTAVALLSPNGETCTRMLQQTMVMHSLSARDIAEYIDADQPLDCVGAYRIEGRGRALFSRIEPDDETGVMGFPLDLVGELLRAAGLLQRVFEASESSS